MKVILIKERLDAAAHRESTCHLEMVHWQKNYCLVDTDDENGIFTENGIDEENGIFLKEVDENENGHISEEVSTNDDGQSNEDGWSDDASKKEDY